MKKRLLFITAFIATSTMLLAQTWSQSGTLSPTFGNAISSTIIMSHNGVLYSIGTGIDGLYKSTDDGANWSIMDFANNGIPNSNSTNYGAATTIGNRIYVGQSGNTKGDIFYSTDDGANWIIDTLGLPTGIAGGRQHVLEMWTHKGYVFARLEISGNYYKKLPADAGWTKITTFNSNINGFITTGDTLWANNNAGIDFSVDTGMTWTTPANSGIPLNAFASAPVNTLGVAYNNGVFYAGTQDFFSVPQNQGLLKSTDRGQNWSVAGHTSLTDNILKIYPNGNSILLLTGTSNPTGLLESADGGLSSTDISSGLPSSFLSIANHNGSLCVGGLGAGVFKQGSPTAINEYNPENNIASYPNPFNNVLTILNEDALPIIIDIVNITGQVVLSTQTTKNQTTLDTRNLSRGLYILKVTDSETGELLSTQKVINQ